MGQIERFMAYAAAFEDAYASDDWSKLIPFFTENTVYHFIAAPPLGGRHEGRAAVFAQFKASVDGFDRRFDTRTVELLEGPVEKDGGVWMRWTAIYQRAGMPELRMEGEERALFEGDRISLLEDRITDEEGNRVLAYMNEHGAKLKPAH